MITKKLSDIRMTDLLRDMNAKEFQQIVFEQSEKTFISVLFKHARRLREEEEAFAEANEAISDPWGNT